TCGADGAVIGTRDALWKCGVHPVEAVDATGTGDAFVAGFIHALLDRKSLEECIRAGAALGASCVRSMGATTGVFSADELAGYLATHPLPRTEICRIGGASTTTGRDESRPVAQASACWLSFAAGAPAGELLALLGGRLRLGGGLGSGRLGLG